MPYFWWTTIFTLLTALWQNVYKWSAISVAIRMYVVESTSIDTLLTSL